MKMIQCRPSFCASALALLCLVAPAPAAAQTIGTFRWQVQPYCNVISLTVVQQGAQYQVDGLDDQCGGSQRASVTGLAFLNPNGSVGFGLNIVTTPGGQPVHVAATISLGSLSGTWFDSTGATGPFVLTPGAGTGGSPRPAVSIGAAAGFGNVKIGLNALNVNNPGSGENNTALGSNTLASNTFGFLNTASGADALRNNTVGDSNTATGARALRSNTTGSANTANGAEALRDNTGSANTASGAFALRVNTVGNDNTASGYQALRDNLGGSNNTASGSNALLRNTTGARNTASGKDALSANLNGSDNTANGTFALLSNTGGIRNTASGLSALESNGTGNFNTASGSLALSSNFAGNNNTAVGAFALENNFSGSNNTGIGFGAGVSNGFLANATAIGANALVNASNKIRLGDANVTVIEGQVDWSFTSDRTKKENVRPVDAEGVLQKLRQVGVTSWNYIGQDATAFRHYGPMAQDFYAAFGHDGVGTVGSPTTMSSGNTTGILMLAVQALEQRSADQQAREARLVETVNQQQRELADLKAMLASLERALAFDKK